MFHLCNVEIQNKYNKIILYNYPISIFHQGLEVIIKSLLRSHDMVRCDDFHCILYVSVS